MPRIKILFICLVILTIGKFKQIICLNRHFVNSDSVIWWIDLTVSPGTEYAFQYLVDGTIRTGDPYSEKILDPWNDQYIPSTSLPKFKTLSCR